MAKLKRYNFQTLDKIVKDMSPQILMIEVNFKCFKDLFLRCDANIFSHLHHFAIKNQHQFEYNFFDSCCLINLISKLHAKSSAFVA